MPGMSSCLATHRTTPLLNPSHFSFFSQFHSHSHFPSMASSSSSHKLPFTESHDTGTFTVSKILYDAFLNHRGPDTKDTLAFALYDSLEEKGLKTFLDDQELQLGDSIGPAIQSAIYSSSVHIAIFSPRYAESPWCLNELLDMLKTKGALFIPVFCDVKPSDVRFPDKGVYKDAFAMHEEKGRFSKEALDDWKSALHSASLVSGYEFSTPNDNVETLCSKIALAVQQKVGNTFQGFPRYLEDAKLPEATAPAKKTSLVPRDSHPVGIDSKFQDMEGLLNNPEIRVIAVVGMGGLGKTFLLQHLFTALKSRYQHSIWLSISKSYSVKSLQWDINSHIGLEIERVSEERAAELIHDRLRGKSCLIVLDDVWTVSTEDNLLDKLGLPGDEDCKVVVSSRNREVATNLKAQIYEMNYLSDKESWELFCFHAFPDCKENRAPPHLKEVGHEIVKQCGNLPLAIKTTAASLANTKSLSKWEYKRRQVEKAIIPFGERDPVMDILRLSYDSLPAHLKDCFSYLSFFPQDARIDPEYLIYLWIAEGFVPAGEEQWDTAWNWLDQLAQLCLVQLISHRNWLDQCAHLHPLFLQQWEAEEYRGLDRNVTEYCAIHDLLHDLAINISIENKCVFSLRELTSTHANISTGWRRILLAKKDVDDNDLSQSLNLLAYLRTLSLSRNMKIISIPEKMFSPMRGLRILDLSWTGISALPESLGKMILLKVLNLRGTKIKYVPECVRYLKSLLFLAMPTACLKIPEWISELTCLQHLECPSIRDIADGITKLVSLRRLGRGMSWVKLYKIEDGLACMTQLEAIGLIVWFESELKMIEKGLIAHLVKMRCLGIKNRILGERVKELQLLPENIRAMKHLECLTLKKFAVPSWMCDLANLKELELNDCHCIDYPELEGMPNLVKLVLEGNKWCSKLPKAFGKSGAFPYLRFFKVMEFEKLEEFLELEEGAMASLETLHLGFRCPSLKIVEGTLERLKSLQVFYYFTWGAKQLKDILKEEGEYRNKIEAINPHLIITECHRFVGTIHGNWEMIDLLAQFMAIGR